MTVQDAATDAIFELIRNFNFDRVEKTMIATDWKWAIPSEGRLRVPTIDEMKDQAIRLLFAAQKQNTVVSSGGFEATYKVDEDGKENFTLKFVVAWQSERVI
jgi:hypothetical protein